MRGVRGARREGAEAAMSETTMTGLVELVGGLNATSLRHELEELHGIKAWAMKNLGVDYGPGDAVEVVSDRPSTTGGGWSAYAEALAPDAIGKVGEFRFDTRRGDWWTTFIPDRAWSVSEYPTGTFTRYWKGRFEETPEGYEPPSKFDREHYPDGKQKLFMFDVGWLRKATP